MKSNISSYQKTSFDDIVEKYPKTTAGFIRRLKEDLKKNYKYITEDKNIKQIKITKIDKKTKIMYLWVHKNDRKGIPKILSLLIRYPFNYILFDRNTISEYLLECTVEIKPTKSPKGIIVLN